MKNTRNSRIELLRIISISMIVLSHYCVHGFGQNYISNIPFGINKLLLSIGILGNLGSIIFIMITGYFLVNSTKLKVNKLAHLVLKVLFYSIIIYFMLLILGVISFDLKQMVMSFFPITFKEYWFASAYIVLYLLHPFINKLLNTFNRECFIKYLLLLFFVFSILHTLTTADFYGNELIQFILFYSLGAYLNKYPDNNLGKNNNNYKIVIISSIIIVISIIAFNIIGTKVSIFSMKSTYLLGRTSPFTILLGWALLDIFSRGKIVENKMINLVSRGVFGVYLISDNKFLRPIIWDNIFRCKSFIYSPYLILHMLFSVLIVIIVCIIVDLLVIFIIEKPLFRLLDCKIDAIQNWFNNKFAKVISRFIDETNK